MHISDAAKVPRRSWLVEAVLGPVSTRHLDPLAGSPWAHLHTFCRHTRFVFCVGGENSNSSLSLHGVVGAQIVFDVAVAFVSANCNVQSHSNMAAHLRSVVGSPGWTSYSTSFVHTLLLAQAPAALMKTCNKGSLQDSHIATL